MKKQLLSLLALLLLLCALLSLGGCGAQEDPALYTMTVSMIEAVAKGDRQLAYEHVQEVITPEEFEEIFTMLHDHLKEAHPFSLTLLGVNVSKKGGVTTQSQTYRIAMGSDLPLSQQRFLRVVSAKRSDLNGLSAFQLYYDSEPDVTVGSLTTMRGASFLQWAVLLIALAEIGFMLWAVVDCARHRFPQWGWWIVVILTGCVSFRLYYGADAFRFFFTFLNPFHHTALLSYHNGGMALRLLVPIGTIVYTVKRRGLLAAKPSAPPAPTPVPPPEEASKEEPHE